MPTDFSVRRATWRHDEQALRNIRESVFIHEQNVPADLEWDGLDDAATHVLALAPGGQPIGTARLLADGHIGRMAVVPAWRQRGVGHALLTHLCRVAEQQGLPEVKLAAQTHAIGFYQGQGFGITSDIFMDAGIPHRWMVRTLSKTGGPMDTLENYRLGDTAELLKLDDRDTTRRIALHMVSQARRSLHLFTHDLDPSIYDNESFVEAVKQLAIRSPQTEIKILLRDPTRALQFGHRLIELARRLSSHIRINRLDPEHRNRTDAWLVVDGVGFMRRVHAERYEGVAQFNDSAEARQILHQFESLWERSAPESEFRRLHL